jgi:leader peptidase (prepilin peptidase)/N-methyltransferase
MHSDENELSAPYAEKKITAGLWVLGYALFFITSALLARIFIEGRGDGLVWLWRMLVLGPALLLLIWYDVREFRLPDMITLPLIFSGLAFARLDGADQLLRCGLGAAFGYFVIWGLRWIWLRYRGHPGIGLGDAKLLSAGGAWLGIGLVPGVILLSSAVGIGLIVFSVLLQRQKNFSGKNLMPFGLALSPAIWAFECLNPLIILY